MSPRVVAADSPALLDALFAFRYGVYAGELGCRLSADAQATRRLRDDLDACAYNYAAVCGDEVVGSLRVVDGGDLPRVGPFARRYPLREIRKQFVLAEVCMPGRLAIAPAQRGSSLMLRLMAAAYTDARRRGARVAVSDCSPHLLPLYKGIGYVPFGRPFEDPSFGFKVPIVWVLGDLARMGAIHSPLLGLGEGFPPDPEGARWLADRGSGDGGDCSLGNGLRANPCLSRPELSS
jgi:predicted GNAT family N-acyltransferase